VEGYTLRQIIAILEIDTLRDNNEFLFRPLKDHVKTNSPQPLPTGYFTDGGSDGLYTLEQIITNLKQGPGAYDVDKKYTEKYVRDYIENKKVKGEEHIGYTYEQLVSLISFGHITKLNILNLTPQQFVRLDTFNGNVQDGIVMETALVEDGWTVNPFDVFATSQAPKLRAQKLNLS
jgi:hypothetical protein